jgi:hypothetical protein
MAVAAYSSKILVTSPPSIALSNEATSASTDRKTYTIVDQTKRMLDDTTPAAVQSSSDGLTWTTITTGFTLRYIGAQVLFASAQPVGTQIRLSSGKYFPTATVGAGANTAEFAGERQLEDVTVFNDNGVKSVLPTLLSGEITTSGFWLDHARVKALADGDRIIGSFVLPTGRRIEGYMYTGKCGIKGEIDKSVTEDLTLQLTDEFFRS